ncbi:MAG: glutathione S-transferase [Rhodospirillaceae bacterium]|jgi:glutathione S-transferase|nr:glutathione S-transferase [Rhodospirillaceae bacterium]MBT4045434.1 glutathione S-transferase [Rhodospirillaceae bacterium]MBT4691511.1 glutathione S-transferase [Rhodospirillaceae bacterium]MBT5083014.1 glutathione S-transferase [Rhodospirillaceae bacterium]MBT5524458.1 glutathione S-transferase [Rhodospirillaceae bacterium]
MKFYDCSTAPSPRRVRIFIAEKGLDIETVNIDMRKGEQMSEEFRAINPGCTVPALVLDDGTTLVTTAGIRNYLEDLHPTPPLMGATAKEKGLIADVQWKIEFSGSMAMAEALRNSAPRMKGRALPGPDNFEQIPELAERGKTRVQLFLDRMDAMIGDKPFVAGDNYSVADIDLLILVDFAGWLKMSIPEDAANAQRWYESVSSRPSAKL